MGYNSVLDIVGLSSFV